MDAYSHPRKMSLVTRIENWRGRPLCFRSNCRTDVRLRSLLLDVAAWKILIMSSTASKRRSKKRVVRRVSRSDADLMIGLRTSIPSPGRAENSSARPFRAFDFRHGIPHDRCRLFWSTVSRIRRGHHDGGWCTFERLSKMLISRQVYLLTLRTPGTPTYLDIAV